MTIEARDRWSRVGAAFLVLTLFLVACSKLFDQNTSQCNIDSDCTHFGGHPYCVNHVCTVSNLGPENCVAGPPTKPNDFRNGCSTAKCEVFDNCERLNLCDTAAPPGAVDPPIPDAGMGSTIDAPPPPVLPACVDPAVRNTIVVGGSTAVQPFLSVVASLLAQLSTPYQIAYQPSGSCTGVDQMFNPDPNKRIVKDIANRQALLFDLSGASTPCTFGAGAALDVAVSDVFSSTCNAAYLTSSQIADYHGPVQPMTFVVPSGSSETSISAEMAHNVFGRGNTDGTVAPYTDPNLYFVRSSGSGTQQMISRAVGVDPKKWWGIDRGGSSQVRNLMEAVAPAQASQAIGILSTDFADPERSRIRILAFRGSEQTCAYYPDSTLFTRDKANVRDGHYPIWGPIHFYANVMSGVPSAAAGALVTRFAVPRLDQPLLDAVVKSGLVPACAMRVSRTEEMGALSTFSPEFQCGCYFETRVEGGSTPASCQACNGPGDCPATAPGCNNGFCEKR